MTISIIYTSNAEKPWVDAVCTDYARKLVAPWNLNFIHINAGKRKKNAAVQKILQEEGDKMWKLKPKNCINIVLDRTGKSLSSTQLATTLNQYIQIGQSVNFFIGGPEGISAELIAKADLKISLSALTFPHPMVRVIIAEQIYRAWSIIHNHPYHR